MEGSRRQSQEYCQTEHERQPALWTATQSRAGETRQQCNGPRHERRHEPREVVQPGGLDEKLQDLLLQQRVYRVGSLNRSLVPVGHHPPHRDERQGSRIGQRSKNELLDVSIVASGDDAQSKKRGGAQNDEVAEEQQDGAQGNEKPIPERGHTHEPPRLHQEQQTERHGDHERHEAPVEREAVTARDRQPFPALVGSDSAQERTSAYRECQHRERHEHLRGHRDGQHVAQRVKQEISEQVRSEPVDFEEVGERFIAREDFLERRHLSGMLREIDRGQMRAEP